MKKVLTILSLCLVVVGVSGCFGSSSNQTQTNQTNNEAINETHKELISSSDVTITDTMIHDDSEYVVYFTQNGCHNCEVVDPYLLEFAKTKMMPVYVYDINIDTWSSAPFSNPENENVTLPAPVTNDVYVKYTPTMYYVKDGEMVSCGVGAGNQPDSVITLLTKIQNQEV